VGTELSIPVEIPVRQPPTTVGRVLGVVYRAISVQLIQKAGFSRKNAQTGVVTLIQRFGSAWIKSPGAILNSRGGGGQDARNNLNVHFHGAHPCAPPAVVQIGYPAW
jgi:hypothetical protein